jgi:hypothetical protein
MIGNGVERRVSGLRTEVGVSKAHPNRLRFMYAYTILTGGILGFALLVAPSTMLPALGIPTEEPFLGGILYSVWLAEAILSAFGLRYPVKFAPVLLLQLTYKVIWLVAIIIPHLVTGQLPTFAMTTSDLYITFVIGDMIAIPWRHIFTSDLQ